MVKKSHVKLKYGCAIASIFILIILTWWVAIKPSLPNSASQNSTNTNATVVINAKDYQQFWLWTPPKNPDKLSQATTLYLLQGEIDPILKSQSPQLAHSTLGNLTSKGLAVRPLPHKKIWLVYRVTGQTWQPDVMPKILARLKQWQQAGNDVQGIQIDFDSPTYQLDNYAKMLTLIREQLPSDYKLSVTGLLDWANQAQNPAFLAVCQQVNELVMQTYQGVSTLPEYAVYLKKLEYMPIDFKIGLVEHGLWQGKSNLEANPHFKGYVVFLHEVR